MTSMPFPSAVVEGIDISEFNTRVNFDDVRDKGGKRFVIARAICGLQNDKLVRSHIANARSAGGFKLGLYGFGEPKESAWKQAQFFCDVEDEIAPDMPGTLDIEKTAKDSGLSEQEMSNWCLEFLGAYEARRQRRMTVYTGAYILGQAAVTSGLASRALHLACYSARGPKVDPPTLPVGWTSWRLLQWRGNADPSHGVPSGHCPGVAGDVDLDYFNGSLSDLEDFCSFRISSIGAPDPRLLVPVSFPTVIPDGGSNGSEGNEG
jgi:lysozyme